MREPSNKIPFTRPYIGTPEIDAVTTAMRDGMLGGNGEIGIRVQRQLSQILGVKHVLLTTSGSHALEMTMMVSDIGPGDEVILPSFAFVTAATAVVRQGGRPVFAEIDENTFNLDPDDVARRITPRTRAIITVHYAGWGCHIHKLMQLATQHKLTLVEDAAQAIGAKYDGRNLGTIGHMGCYSFHSTKNVVCGEGGAFCTDDDILARRAEIVREKGTDRSAFLRGEVDKYTWVDVGSSYVLSDLLAAILEVQLKRLEETTKRRVELWRHYYDGLADLEAEGKVRRPTIDPRAEPNGHIFLVTVDSKCRDRILSNLKSSGVAATFHFIPLHSSPYAIRHLGYRPEDLPITERVAKSLIRLPIYHQLSFGDIEYIIRRLRSAF